MKFEGHVGEDIGQRLESARQTERLREFRRKSGNSRDCGNPEKQIIKHTFDFLFVVATLSMHKLKKNYNFDLAAFLTNQTSESHNRDK